MSNFNSKGKPELILDPLTLGKLYDARRAHKSYFNPENYAVEKLISKQRCTFDKNRPQIDIKTLKTIIDKSLYSAKNNREAFHDLSANYLRNTPKEETKSLNSQFHSKLKYSALVRFQSNKPVTFREVRPKSPIDCKQSFVVFKYNSKNRLLKQVQHQFLNSKNKRCDFDEDKMDSNLDTYYLQE